MEDDLLDVFDKAVIGGLHKFSVSARRGRHSK